MPILSMSAGRVTAIWGSAFYRQQDGSLKAVHVGDDLIGGQQILTDQEGIVEIEPAALSPQILKLIQAANEVDHSLKAIDAHDSEAVPAAGLDASGSGSLLPGIRVERIAEALAPNEFGSALPQSAPFDRILPSAVMAVPVMESAQAEPPVPIGPSVPSVSPVPTLPPEGDATLPPGEHGVPVAAPATNLMIVLDVSADMASSNGSDGLTRLQATVQAVDHLLDHYAQAGQVAVRLVTFADTAHAVGDQWVSVSEAKALLSTLTAHGGPHYDMALPMAETAFLTDAGRLPDAQNVSYLFAGGAPIAPPLVPLGGHAPSHLDLGLIDTAEEAAWTRFLTDHSIVSHAVGVGPLVKPSDLDPVAYDGQHMINQDATVVSMGADGFVAPLDLRDLLQGEHAMPSSAHASGHAIVLDGSMMYAASMGAINSLLVQGLGHVDT